MDHDKISLSYLNLLDIGGQSKVYKCVMTSSRHSLPIDVIAKDLTNIKEEDLILKELNHDNIVKFYGINNQIFEEKPTRFLVLEYIENGNLENYIDNRYGMLKSNVMQKIKGMIEGINYIHRKGILHLDLHPKNILVSSRVPSQCFKITDFGLSKIEEDGASLDWAKGRAGYMSPEIIRNEMITKHSDIWPLGCIIWFILTKNEPFNFTEIAAKNYKVGSDLHPDIPNDWPVIIQKLLFYCWDKRCTTEELLPLFRYSIKIKNTEAHLKKYMPLDYEHRFIQIKRDRIVPAIIWNCVDKKKLFAKYNFIDNQLIKRYESQICRRKFKKVKTGEDLLKFLNESGYFGDLCKLKGNIINCTEMISKLTVLLSEHGSYWKRLARTLGMPDIHIDEISNEAPDEILDEILEFWSEDHSTHPFTSNTLENIFQNLHIEIE